MTVWQQSSTVDSLDDVQQQKDSSADKNFFFSEEQFGASPDELNRRTALCRVMVVIITHEAVQRPY